MEKDPSLQSVGLAPKLSVKSYPKQNSIHRGHKACHSVVEIGTPIEIARVSGLQTYSALPWLNHDLSTGWCPSYKLVYKPHSYLVRDIYHKPQLSHLCLNLAWLVVEPPL